MAPITIALVDDHPLMLAGVVNLFEVNDDFSVVAKGTTADDALQINKQLRPDVMVLDLFMPGNVFETINEIVTKSSGTKVVAFTAMTASDYAVKALNAGASGYILKGSSAEELVQGVRAAHSGETFITPSFACKVIEALRVASLRRMSNGPIKLSIREEQIVRLLLRGFTNREIAIGLGIGEKTVKNYMTILMQKLHARNRLEVLIAAQKLEVGSHGEPMSRH
ncbi:response regulator [Phyllobacterium endophyticum]|uniref:DNA-binding response regulator n=1 Tax=Phyllobacterium endophyticum TaxID=1149773 RepID=A0A2P7APV5_9HYPH|nr:response regulator transcription factor [Phyllobacterium endophyticum]MBB3233682.1 DNA-binding NarL/FixJ family response regulator [Phyllobacterium endophyticum]PSH56252.1 DNA-binding response regulator [Phyllobacterium endophyticum]TXR47176.1 response regulator transcription factor [Phyllobacterium endophyticum]TYR41111.1 response regulator transcription factor [Phyllobacterium endophyticum]